MSFEGQDRRSAAYRAEIDGLRAIAVVAVMGFHAALPGFSGGYAGVDIFFVISGYLITGIIARERDAGHFRLGGFYLRRARRILPALTLVLFACVPLALLLLPDPQAVRGLGSALAASVLFCANFYFWRMPAGYFAPAAHDHPLLHLWSLAVEEQFYLLYPLAFALVHRFARRWLGWAIAAALLASLALSEWASMHMASANYFLLPTRAWELLAGALVALSEPRWRRWTGRMPAIVPESLAVLGVLLIGYTLAAYDETTRFPGLSALPVVLGTALVLVGARPARPVGNLLGSRPFVAAGLVSYSAYLWHQPLLAFARAHAIDHVGIVPSIALLLLAFALAAVTWRLVELPFRRSPRLRRPRVLLAGLGAGTALLAIGAALWVLDGLPQRFSQRHLALLHLGTTEGARELPCFFPPGTARPLDKGCRLGNEGNVAVAFLGDSHALALAPAFVPGLERRHERALLLTQAGCPPTRAFPQPEPWYGHCAAFNRRAFAYVLARPEIHTVVLAARWTYYLERRWADNGEGGVENGPRVAPASRPARQGMAQAYRDAVETLLGAGKRVVLVYPVPEAGWVVPVTIAKRELRGSPPAPLTTSAAWVKARNRRARAALDAIGAHPGLIRLDPARRLCDTVVPGRCILQDGPAPLYFDDDHLSAYGARYVLPDAGKALGSR